MISFIKGYGAVITSLLLASVLSLILVTQFNSITMVHNFFSTQPIFHYTLHRASIYCYCYVLKKYFIYNYYYKIHL